MILKEPGIHSVPPVQLGSAPVNNTAPSLNGSFFAASSNGCRLVSAANGGGIYIWQSMLSSKTNFTPFAFSPRISWIVPSMPFVLQESADLNTTDWIVVTMQPTLNLTNLYHEVNMPLSSANRFYHFKSL